MRIESKNGALAVICLVFFGIGVPITVIGPALPELAASTGSNLAELGALFTALFIGALITQATSGFLIDRIGERLIIAVGIAVAALGILAIGLAPSLLVVLAGAALLGAGNGGVLAAANVYIARIFGARSLSPLNLVNLFFGIGAVTGPILAALALDAWDTALPVIIAGAIFYLSLAPVTLLMRARVSDFAGEEQVGAKGSVYRAPFLWVMGGLLLLYVGTESGFGGWSTTYIDRTTSLDLGTAALVASGYWLALSMGRVAGAVLGRRLSPENLLLGSLSGAIVGGVLLVAGTGNAALTVVATLVLGFSLGPVFPTVFALTTSTFRNAPGKAVAVILSLGSIGGMFLPWLQGSLMEGVSPSAMVMLVAGALLAMLGLYGGARVVAGRKSVQASTHQVVQAFDEC